MNNRYPSLAVLAVTLVSVLLAACQGAKPAAVPGTFTEADVAKLKWIEGTWRGTGENQPPFYERYHFEGTTMIVEGFGTDETLQNVAESSRFELRDGRFGAKDDNAESAASWISDTAVQFIPVRNSKNAFRFEKQDDGTWRAVIEWPAAGDKPARTVIYRLEPWPPKK